MVGYWDFNEDKGDIALDNSEYKNDGTIYRATRIDNGGCGKALQFDGDDYIFVSDSASLDLTGSFTIELWMDYQGSEPGYLLAKKSKQYYGPSITPSFTRMHLGNGETNQEWDANFDSRNAGWVHIAWVYNKKGGKLRAYLDGELHSTFDYSEPIATNDDPLYIGRRVDGVFFKGILDELRIYNYPLTQAEIKRDMEKCKVG